MWLLNSPRDLKKWLRSRGQQSSSLTGKFRLSPNSTRREHWQVLQQGYDPDMNEDDQDEAHSAQSCPEIRSMMYATVQRSSLSFRIQESLLENLEVMTNPLDDAMIALMGDWDNIDGDNKLPMKELHNSRVGRADHPTVQFYCKMTGNIFISTALYR